PVPLLADVLAEFDLEIDVEIKALKVGRMAALVAATARVIERSGRVDRIVVSSFDPIALLQFHRQLPDVPLAHLVHDEQPLPRRPGGVGNWLGASLLPPEHTLCTETAVKAWRTQGLPINAWTVDDRHEIERLARLGVDGMFCNDPAHALAVLSAMG